MSARVPIAITGIGCRFGGGVKDARSFWELLQNGADCVGPVPPERWNSSLFYSENKDHPGSVYVRDGAFLSEPVDMFDPEAFGISEREAGWLDPQQRLLLEVTHEAFEDAGYPTEKLAGSRMGVFVGGFHMDAGSWPLVSSNRALVDTYTALGTRSTILSARLSYLWDLRGPCLTIDTACSSSLVALHYACASIASGDCDTAIVGGANVSLHPSPLTLLCKARLVSPDGRSKAFDATADGYGRGEGAAVVLLKPLDRAIADGDRIYSVVLATASNQDGRTPGGMSTPSRDAQEALLRDAYRRAGVTPNEVAYVEAHGTGTVVGDATEAGALGKVLGSERTSPLAIGSVKPNIGHTEAAAGVAGLIKAALCLHHKQIPPTIVRELTPNIPFYDYRLRVVQESEEYPSGDRGRFAGVNSFGFGGSNAHAVLTEAPAATSHSRATAKGSAPQGGVRLLPISAQSRGALVDRAASYRDAVRDAIAGGSFELDDLVHTVASRRGHGTWRAAAMVTSLEEAREALDAVAEGRTDPRVINTGSSSHATGVTWVFGGMGAQWWAMGRELLDAEPVFRKAIEDCDKELSKHVSWSLLEELRRDESQSQIQRNEIAQAANFAVQVALTRLWRSWGLEPAAIVGHSVGEIAAAHAAGCITFEEACLVIHHRGRLLQRAAGAGKMLAVGVSARDAEFLIAPWAGSVSIASVNSPTSVTLSGDVLGLEKISERLTATGTFNRFLRVEVPYHSHHMNPIMAELGECLQSIRPTAPAVPLYSTVTGAKVTDALHDAAYWVRNVREPVFFARAIESLLDEGREVFLEISAHPTLTSNIGDCAMNKGRRSSAFPSLERKKPERANLLTALANLYTRGVSIAWEAVAPTGELVSLPFYPWQRKPYWAHESEESKRERMGIVGGHPLLQRRLATAQPCWQTEVNDAVLSTLKDHVIQGTVVFPGTAYVETALGMLASLEPSSTVFCLEDVKFHHALAIDMSRFHAIQSIFDPQSGAFSIQSRVGEDANGWVLHATGQTGRAPSEERATADIQALQKRLKPADPAERVYKKLAERGYHYGENFRGVRRWWLGNGELLAEVSPSTLVREEQANYIAHPALFDACVHSTLLLTPGSETCVPVGIERLVIHRKVGGERLWVHAQMLESDGGTATSRFSVYDEEGKIVAEFEGLQVQAVSRTEARRVYDGMLFEPRWDVLPEVAAAPSAAAERQWVILATEEPAAGELERRLRARGETVRRGESLSAADLSAPPVTTHVVCLASAARTEAERDAIGEWVKRTSRITSTLASASRRSAGQSVRCWVVTRAASGVEGSPVDATQSLSWGLGRVAINECNDLGVRLVDLPATVTSADLDELTARLCADEGEEELAIRGGKTRAYRFAQLPATAVGTTVSRRVRANEAAWKLRANAADPKSAQLVEVTELAPKANEVALRLDAMPFAGIGRSKEQRQTILVGRVVSVGAGAEGLTRGDRVIALGPADLSSVACVDRAAVCKLPDDVTAEEAASFEPWLTAKYSLEHVARIGAGTRVLVVGSGNAWEVAAARLAKDAGADVALAFESIDESLRALVEDIARAPSPVSARFGDWVRDWTKSRGVEVMVSSVDFELPRHLPTLLRSGGRFLEFCGGAFPAHREGVQLHHFPTNTSLLRVDALQVLAQDHLLATRLLREVLDLAERKKLPPFGARELSPEEMIAELPALTSKLTKPVVMTVSSKTIRVAASDSALFRANATYLITGGLGGFGLATAKWMVANGARSLVLLGRQGATTDEARQSVAHLQMSGAKVVVEKCDVSDRTQLAAVLERVRQKCPPLKGVYHAATSFDHWNMADLTAERLEAGIRAKVAGAWNLHLLTQADALEHFVLFSSATSLLGVTGLAVYTAANVFLDTLAHARAEQNLPALSVGFGAVGDTGYLVRSETAARAMQHQGFRAMQTSTLLAALRDIVSSGHVHVAVAEADWRKTVQFVPSLGTSPRFAELRAAEAEGTDGQTLRDRLREAPKEKRAELALAYLRTWLSVALRAQPESIDTQTPIDRLGFDSLLAAELKARARKDLEIDLPVMELVSGPTLEKLTARVLAILDGAPTTGGATNGADWDRDASLDEDIRATAPYVPLPDGPRDVLLTGASGFIGAFLLRELLERPNLRIHCLVRPRAEIGAAERLKANLIAHGLGSAWDANRVVVVAGDLSAPRFGLEPEEYERLAAKTDVIIHSGAVVNFAFDYGALAPTNVAGTREVIRFAAHKKTKPLHFISSAYVFAAPPDGGKSSADESAALEGWGRPVLAYTQTKHVADRLAQAARGRGIPTNIYRPGFVMGDTQTGSANMRDLVTSSIRLIAQFGVVPENDPGLAVAPVDYVCRAVVVTALSKAPLNQNLHLVDRTLLQLDHIREALGAHGYSVKSLPRAEFNQQLKQVMSRSSRETQSVMSMLFDGSFDVDAGASATPSETSGRLESRRVVVESGRTLDGLEALGVPPPNVREALNSTIRFLDERRLLRAD